MSSQILKSLHQRPIAYYPVYRQLTGSTTGGILLSQLMYWFSKKDKIFKTDKEIMEETLLSERELKNAKKIIKNIDFITVSLEGLPAKTYYEIDWGKYEKTLSTEVQNDQTVHDETDKQVRTKRPNCVGRNVQAYKNNNQDIDYSESNKKNIKKIKTPFPTNDADLKAYAILKAASSGIKCPIQTYAAFRDHHMAKGSKFVNWKSAFNTWVTNFFKYESKNDYETILVNNEHLGTYNFADEFMNITATKKMMRLTQKYFVDGVVAGTIILKMA